MNLIFAFRSPVTLVQRYVSVKLEVSAAFLYGKNRKHETDGETDGLQRLIRSPHEGRITDLRGDTFRRVPAIGVQKSPAVRKESVWRLYKYLTRCQR